MPKLQERNRSRRINAKSICYHSGCFSALELCNAKIQHQDDDNWASKVIQQNTLAPIPDLSEVIRPAGQGESHHHDADETDVVETHA